MANKLINTDKLSAIADAIRRKTGSTDTYSVDGMVDAISNISVGGGGDTSAEDGLVEGTLTAYSNDRVTTIRNHAFYGCTSLTTIDLPVATSVGNYSFYGCTSLTTIDLPSVRNIGGYAVSSCSSLTTVSLPSAKYIDRYAFSDCSSLTTAILPVATSIGINAFYNCRLLIVVDLPLVMRILANAFSYGYSLTRLILRNTSQVCTLANTNAFLNCYHYHGIKNATYNPDGLQDGYIYVPASLIDEYKGATNWSNFATQFRALEDYTVDGTTTGELDENKI